MKEYLDQQKIGNVHVADIRESDTGALSVRDGVEVTRREVRRERMGHIELAAPVTHLVFQRCTKSFRLFS